MTVEPTSDPHPGGGPEWPDLAGRLIDGGHAHVLPIRVYFEDTDFSGLVYHASYVRWCERGRSDFLRLIGSEHRALMEGIAPDAGGHPKAQLTSAPDAGGHPKAQLTSAPDAGGHPKAQPNTEKAAFVVRRLNFEYLRPARIDDILEVTTRVKEMTAATLVLDQRVSRGTELLCSAEVTVVLVTQSGRVLRLSKALRGRLSTGG